MYASCMHHRSIYRETCIYSDETYIHMLVCVYSNNNNNNKLLNTNISLLKTSISLHLVPQVRISVKFLKLIGIEIRILVLSLI